MIKSWNLPHDVEANIYAGVISSDDLLRTITQSPRVTGGAYLASYEEEERNMTTRVDSNDPAVIALREAREREAAQRGSELLQKVRAWELRGMARGTIIRFIKDFDGGPEYQYAAIKCGVGRASRWYVTGDTATFTDEQLEELLVTGGGFRDMKVVHEGLDAGEDE